MKRFNIFKKIKKGPVEGEKKHPSSSRRITFPFNRRHHHLRSSSEKSTRIPYDQESFSGSSCEEHQPIGDKYTSIYESNSPPPTRKQVKERNTQSSKQAIHYNPSDLTIPMFSLLNVKDKIVPEAIKSETLPPVSQVVPINISHMSQYESLFTSLEDDEITFHSQPSREDNDETMKPTNPTATATSSIDLTSSSKDTISISSSKSSWSKASTDSSSIPQCCDAVQVIKKYYRVRDSTSLKNEENISQQKTKNILVEDIHLNHDTVNKSESYLENEDNNDVRCFDKNDAALLMEYIQRIGNVRLFMDGIKGKNRTTIQVTDKPTVQVTDTSQVEEQLDNHDEKQEQIVATKDKDSKILSKVVSRRFSFKKKNESTPRRTSSMKRMKQSIKKRLSSRTKSSIPTPV